MNTDRRDRGDTLMEVLVALIIVSIAAVAILTTFTTTVRASVEYRGLSDVNTMISALESRATVDLGTIGTFQGCFGGVNPVAAYNTMVRDDLQGYVDDLGLARGHAPGSYTVTVSSVSFWNGASWTPAHYVNDSVTDCPDTSANAAAQLVIVTLRAPNTALYSAVVVAGTPT